MNSRGWMPMAVVCALLAALLLQPGCSKSTDKTPSAEETADRFIAAMNTGKNYYDQGQPVKALETFAAADKLAPGDPDLLLNMANAHLLADHPTNALDFATALLKAHPNDAAANYVAGCAHLRLGKNDEAVKALQTSRDLLPEVAAASYQLGLAHFALKQWEPAIQAFQATMDLEPEHPAAHYNLGQALLRAGRQAEAAPELEKHREILAKLKGNPPGGVAFERCKHTQMRVPFKIEQPDAKGNPVSFVDDSAARFGGAADSLSGPFGIIDVNWRGWNDLFAIQKGEGFRLLMNTNGVFQPSGLLSPVTEGANYSKVLVADLQNDRFEDVMVLGDKGTHVFKFATNGAFTEASAFTRLQGLAATDGALADLDFTGKLDLIAVTSVTNQLKIFRNIGNLFFRDITATSGIPSTLNMATKVVVDDWDGDDLADTLVIRNGQPALLSKQRGGGLVLTNVTANWPDAIAAVTGDINNDLRSDAALLGTNSITVIYGGDTNRTVIQGVTGASNILLTDYDNDGWQDIVVSGNGIRVWRNNGRSGFVERTKELGLDKLTGTAITTVAFADFDKDGDSDLVFALKAGGLRYFRNDGGNKNQQLKVRLFGNRSNASGIGVKLEATAGAWRTIRTATSLPVEIGTGKYNKLDSLTIRWFDLAVPSVDLPVDPTNAIQMAELVLPTGSCPYLYAWDGSQFRFVTDLLGAAPLGLPVAQGHYIDSNPEEHVWIGNEKNFAPRNGRYTLQITEELREVLYLDEAKLVVIDHPPGTEVHSTDKLLPGKPFPPSSLMTLHKRKPLLAAQNHAGTDVTAALQENDRVMASPTQLRGPQLRGLAEPHAITLDFGALETGKPLVLALTGWLRFGGGMANIAGSLHEEFPFPFPIMEVELPDHSWKKLDLQVGAPIGKTKTILVDLSNQLPAGARRLRVTAAFEIHWDRAALFEKAGESATHVARLSPNQTDLHWRGFSEFADLLWSQPLTPVYDRVYQNPKWRITPSGWVTRYGEVGELVAKRDEALALISGGDELTLEFEAKSIPPVSQGLTRDFFLYSEGWDKDADFHVAEGDRIEPMPFHGMNDQIYGFEKRPATIDDTWQAKFNTRWIAPQTLQRPEPQASAK